MTEKEKQYLNFEVLKYCQKKGCAPSPGIVAFVEKKIAAKSTMRETVELQNIAIRDAEKENDALRLMRDARREKRYARAR